MKLASKGICKRLKALGYDGEYSYLLFTGDGVYMTLSEFEKVYGPKPKQGLRILAAPYLEQVAEWLREKHKLYVEIQYCWHKEIPNKEWKSTLRKVGHVWTYYGRWHDTYEDALKNAIEHALSIIEEENK